MDRAQLWRRARELFDQAVELQDEPRQLFLARLGEEDAALRSEVEGLLAADQQAGAGVLTGAVEQAAVESLGTASLVGRRIGPYRVVGELGAGGMGIVFAAERDDGAYRKQVAIKLLPGGVQSELASRRFLTERQVLADLEHPLIARLLDGGTTDDGQAYLVMERIDGLPIDRYCQQNELGLRRRLRLMIRVCAAVSYAHSRLVVHRDLKPSNLLVTADGDPKLLDFGIAKLLDPSQPSAERTNDWAWTPEFASPEQVDGKATTVATDVHGLGVLLYQLLVGYSPFTSPGSTPAELMRSILEVTPVAPSKVAAERAPGAIPERRLGRELDAIVLCALRKEPERRYGSVEQLAADLRNYLESRPVNAVADSWSYRIGKLCRRHWLAGVAVGAVALSLAGGLVARTVEARRAQREAQVATRVSDFLEDLFQASNPMRDASGEITARQLLDVGAERIATELADEPVVRARLLDTMGSAYRVLGQFDRAEELLREALRLREQVSGPMDIDTAETLIRIGTLLEQKRSSAAAEPYLRRALAILEHSLPPDDPRIQEALDHLAGTLIGLVRLDEAEVLLDRVRTYHDRYPERDPRTSVGNLNSLAYLYLEQGRHRELIDMARRAVAASAALAGKDHPGTLSAQVNLVIGLQELGRLQEADAVLAEALPATERVLGPSHDMVGTLLRTQGATWLELSRLEAAAVVLDRALAIHQDAFGSEHFLTHLIRLHQGSLALRQGDPQAAERLVSATLEPIAGGFGHDHYVVAEARQILAEVHLAQGRSKEARQLLEQVLPVRLRTFGEGSLRVDQTRALLASTTHPDR